MRESGPKNVDEYISEFSPKVRAILEQIRQIVRKNAPEAEEIISYRMPAFRLNGILIYFAAFKNHIGVYPPISGDPDLQEALSPYAVPKGNLKFPIDQMVPYDLIERVVILRVRQNLTKPSARTKRK